MKKLLLIYLFINFFLLISCGENTTKEREKAVDNLEYIDNTEIQGETDTTTKSILFFGTSLTAGLGLEPSEAFPALIQIKLDSLNLPYEAINAGLSGETTASGKNRISWVLEQEVDVFVLELGANDGLRGIPVEETRKNLQEIIDVVRGKNPETTIILAGMQMPPNLGQKYTSDFKKMFPELAEKNNIPLIPFLLEGVGAVPKLNQNDGIHPTAEGQEILAENVWEVLKDKLDE